MDAGMRRAGGNAGPHEEECVSGKNAPRRRLGLRLRRGLSDSESESADSDSDSDSESESESESALKKPAARRRHNLVTI